MNKPALLNFIAICHTVAFRANKMIPNLGLFSVFAFYTS